MDYRGAIRQHRVTSLQRRIRYLLSRLFGARLQKSQKVALIDINGQRFKRIILRDSYLAARIEQALEAFGSSPVVPEFVIRYEHEIWVDFIDGEVPATADENLVRELALFYARIYARAPVEMSSAGSIWQERLQRDLRFLGRVGVLSAVALSELGRAGVRLSPEKFWLGFDYNDPVVKNFVCTDRGGLCGIDVESLVCDQLIGLGVAKALMRWMEPYRAVFVDTYARSGAPNFLPYFEFVELAQLAAYTKLMFVEQKWSNVDSAAFERFR